MTHTSRLLVGSVLAIFSATLQSASDIWQEATLAGRNPEPDSRWYHADETALRASLALAPHEALRDESLIVELPMPDGELQSFVVVESPIMEPGLAAAFPAMKTYRLEGIDDAGASGRADLTTRGFRAMLRTARGILFIDPVVEPGQPRIYHSRFRRGAPTQGFACGVHRLDPLLPDPVVAAGQPVNRQQGLFETYRIAVAATNDYVATIGPDTSAVQSEILTAINRVNEIYERDLGVRLLLVANNGILFEDDDEECFSNDDALAMLDENQVWIDERIGDLAYDIGHVFGTGAGGVASLGSACAAGSKARGVTGLPNPTGDPFYIDFVAHEIGHQLSAGHTFNGTTGACGFGNRFAASAFEPGSGSSIMAYAGICGAENLQNNSDATFHSSSIATIDAFSKAGGGCFGIISNGNVNPAVTLPLVDRTIPANTPFRLDVSAGDFDLDTLSYQWDQLDSGDATTAATLGDDLGNNALFRLYEPQADSWRDFPAFGTQVLGQTDLAETLPTNARSLNFRVTVRDNASGQASDDVTLTVANSSGFRVTSPNAGTLDTTAPSWSITWDTGNTENPPVNCATVDIAVVAFDDTSYTNHGITLIASAPNTGTYTQTTPLGFSHVRARIRVMCNGNVFYDISDGDLNVIGSTVAPFDDASFATFFNSGGLTVSKPAANPGPTAVPSGLVDVFAPGLVTAPKVEECTFDPDADDHDSTALDPRLLLVLLSLLGLAWYRRYGLQ